MMSLFVFLVVFPVCFQDFLILWGVDLTHSNGESFSRLVETGLFKRNKEKSKILPLKPFIVAFRFLRFVFAFRFHRFFFGETFGWWSASKPFQVYTIHYKPHTFAFDGRSQKEKKKKGAPVS